jgi:hypothetical protein
MPPRWLHRLAFWSLLSLPAAAAAHGGDAKVVRVAAVDGDGMPWLLQLSGGLAFRHVEGWRFVCAAAFEASTVLHALSADEHSAWVATLRNVHRITDDGRLERSDGQCGDSPIKLIAHADSVYMLARDSAKGRFVVCELAAAGPRVVHSDELAIDDLTSDGSQLWLAQADGEGFALEAVDSGERRSYPRTLPHHAVRLSFASGTLYARLIDFGRTTLVRLSAQHTEPLLDSTGALYGPVESSRGALAGTDGALYALDGQQLTPIDTPWVLDDVDGLAGHAFAFAEGAVYGLPPSGTRTNAPLFALDAIQPPAEAASEACSEQWQRFEREIHASDHTTASDASAPERGRREAAPAAPAASGCKLGGAEARTSLPALVSFFAWALFVRRRAVRH